MIHITLVIDRSGSMYDVHSDTIGGVNQFIESQKAAHKEGELPYATKISVIQFDDEIETIIQGETPEAIRRLYD